MRLTNCSEALLQLAVSITQCMVNGWLPDADHPGQSLALSLEALSGLADAGQVLLQAALASCTKNSGGFPVLF